MVCWLFYSVFKRYLPDNVRQLHSIHVLNIDIFAFCDNALIGLRAFVLIFSPLLLIGLAIC